MCVSLIFQARWIDSHTGLHLGNEFLVEETLSLFVQGAVNGDNIALGEHLLERVDAATANLLFHLGLQWLVVVVEQLLAAKRLETSQHTLTNATDCHGTHDLALEIVLILGCTGDIPLTRLNLLMGGDKVADEHEHGHDGVFSDRRDIATGDLGDGDASIGLVGGIEVHVIGSNTGGDGNLEILGTCQTLCGQVAGMEADGCQIELTLDNLGNVRSGNDDFGIFKFLIKLAIDSILV